MKYIIPATIVILATFVQVTFPAHISIFHLVIDVALVVLVLIGIFIKPATSAVWLAILAGFLLDIWHPNQFGVWLIACLAVMGCTLLFKNKVLPRITNFGLFVAATISLLVGLTIIFLFNRIGSSLSFSASLAEYLRFYLLSLPLDLVFFGFGLWLTKRLVKIVNPGANV